MLILGLAPSLSCTGWGVIRSEGSRLSHVANGQIATDTKAPMAQRLAHLHREVAAVIATYAPDRAACEEVFANKNAQSTIKLAQARGSVLAACGVSGTGSARTCRAVGEEGDCRYGSGGEGAGAGDAQGAAARREDRRGRCCRRAGGGDCGCKFGVRRWLCIWWFSAIVNAQISIRLPTAPTPRIWKSWPHSSPATSRSRATRRTMVKSWRCPNGRMKRARGHGGGRRNIAPCRPIPRGILRQLHAVYWCAFKGTQFHREG